MKSLKRRHILITGALGHIGSALIREPDLQAGVEKITMVDNLFTQRYTSLFNLPQDMNYRFIEGDVASVVTDKLLRDVDAVIHLAGTVDPVQNFLHPQNLKENNLRITRHLAAVCLSSNVPVIFASSTSVYTPKDSVVDEKSLDLKPTGAYAQCKLEEESIFLETCNQNRFTIFRFGTIFGPSPGMRFQTAVSKFCWQSACGIPIEIWRTALEQVRPYLAVSDCTALLARTVNQEAYLNRVINAATCNVTVQDVLDCIRMQNLSPVIALTESPAMNNLSYAVSTSLAENLGFSFSSSLSAGVAQTLQLIRGITNSHR